MAFYTQNERIYAFSVDEYLEAFENGYHDIRFSGDHEALLKVLRVEGEHQEAYRYAYAVNLVDAEQYDLAFQIIQGLVEDGFDRAVVGLSYCYGTGKGVEKNVAKSAELLHSIEDKNIAGCFFNLGFCYRKGEGVEKDLERALAYFEKAVSMGHASSGLAAANVLREIAEANGAEVDEKRCFAYLLQGALNGSLNAMDEVQFAYKWGKGCEIDPIAAKAWRALIDRNSRGPKETLDHLFQSERLPGTYYRFDDSITL